MTWPALGPDGLEVFAIRKSDCQLFRAMRGSVNDPFGPAQRYLFGTAFDTRRSTIRICRAMDGRSIYRATSAAIPIST
jgi:hypothetical protein